MKIPEEYELVSVFECLPTLLDDDVLYYYNVATFEFENANNEVFKVRIAPAYGDFRMEVTRQNSPEPIAEFDFSGMSELEILEDSKDTTKIGIASDTLYITVQMKPRFFVRARQYNGSLEDEN